MILSSFLNRFQKRNESEISYFSHKAPILNILFFSFFRIVGFGMVLGMFSVDFDILQGGWGYFLWRKWIFSPVKTYVFSLFLHSSPIRGGYFAKHPDFDSFLRENIRFAVFYGKTGVFRERKYPISQFF